MPLPPSDDFDIQGITRGGKVLFGGGVGTGIGSSIISPLEARATLEGAPIGVSAPQVGALGGTVGSAPGIESTQTALAGDRHISECRAEGPADLVDAYNRARAAVQARRDAAGASQLVTADQQLAATYDELWKAGPSGLGLIAIGIGAIAAPFTGGSTLAIVAAEASDAIGLVKEASKSGNADDTVAAINDARRKIADELDRIILRYPDPPVPVGVDMVCYLDGKRVSSTPGTGGPSQSQQGSSSGGTGAGARTIMAALLLAIAG